MGTVLGISPGTRSIGLAVLSNRKLLDRKIQSFKGKWSEKKLESIIHSVNRYVKQNMVTAVAIKIPDELPVSANYIQLVGTLNVYFEQKDIKPMYYMLSELKKHYCPKEDINTAALRKCIVVRCPDLLPEYQSEQSNRNKYYTKVFEAVAAACMYQDRNIVLPT